MKLIRIMLVISFAINIVLGFFFVSQGVNNKSESMSAEEFSGINNYQYNVPCNTVFGRQVCASDFVGLNEGEAAYKARIHGLNSVVNTRDDKYITGFVSKKPFRIIFKLNNEVVTEAFFQ